MGEGFFGNVVCTFIYKDFFFARLCDLMECMIFFWIFCREVPYLFSFFVCVSNCQSHLCSELWELWVARRNDYRAAYLDKVGRLRILMTECERLRFILQNPPFFLLCPCTCLHSSGVHDVFTIIFLCRQRKCSPTKCDTNPPRRRREQNVRK